MLSMEKTRRTQPNMTFYYKHLWPYMWQQPNGLSCNPKQAVSPQFLIRLVDCGVCDSVQHPSLLPLFCDLSLLTTAITAH